MDRTSIASGTGICSSLAKRRSGTCRQRTRAPNRPQCKARHSLKLMTALRQRHHSPVCYWNNQIDPILAGKLEYCFGETASILRGDWILYAQPAISGKYRLAKRYPNSIPRAPDVAPSQRAGKRQCRWHGRPALGLVPIIPSGFSLDH
jgi:hypothetical protein